MSTAIFTRPKASVAPDSSSKPSQPRDPEPQLSSQHHHNNDHHHHHHHLNGTDDDIHSTELEQESGQGPSPSQSQNISNPNNSSLSDLISNNNASINTEATTMSNVEEEAGSSPQIPTTITSSSQEFVARSNQVPLHYHQSHNIEAPPHSNNNSNNSISSTKEEQRLDVLNLDASELQTSFNVKVRASSEPFVLQYVEKLVDSISSCHEHDKSSAPIDRAFPISKIATPSQLPAVSYPATTDSKTTAVKIIHNDDQLSTTRRRTYPQDIDHAFDHPSIQQSSTLKNDHTLNDSANQEIQRMKFMILNKRESKKNKRNFLDDDKVLVGNKVSEGHSNYIMAYNMLTGIRVAVSRCSGIMKPLKEQDFKASKKLTFDITGNELTPSSRYDFKFKDYSPNVFRELRELFGLDPADYLVSLTAKYILSEVNSPGKSGSFFYYSRDYKFIIKTIHRSEHITLRRILKSYHQHVRNNPNTLVSQFYGLHRLKMPINFSGQKRKIYFIVMNNLFPANKEIHRTYDLKGSLWKRETLVKEEHKKHKAVLKDQNWLANNQHMLLGPKKKNKFLEQIEKDVAFLKAANIMDYSLLVGIHDLAIGNVTNQNFSVFYPKDSTNRDAINSTNPIPVDEVEVVGQQSIRPMNDSESVKLTSVQQQQQQFYFYNFECGFRGTNDRDIPTDEIYYLGIIDCLTNYSYIKRAETVIKGFYQNRKQISAVPAAEYGDRFLSFIKEKGFKK
ncbi:1-phosphatidylinositol-4-phosphate 5-kinase [Saccharomycopsis crataegensis]|uniref:1-phosphatidylinositol-4-phosphate 5-kinase n=1 Tax=Saccharomycopsis crataegensis TaxID=43959 RepID=A0AAV5QDI1_9ASCO|nr:1-phosphatidylinositol-4-phosphate 5-kinase [Saccharomycopsis crataegensis]